MVQLRRILLTPDTISKRATCSVNLGKREEPDEKKVEGTLKPMRHKEPGT